MGTLQRKSFVGCGFPPGRFAWIARGLAGESERQRVSKRTQTEVSSASIGAGSHTTRNYSRTLCDVVRCNDDDPPIESPDTNRFGVLARRTFAPCRRG